MATPIPTNSARFTLAEIASATSGELVGPGELVVQGVTTDTRTVASGNLYVALRGERHDGHAFVPQACARGAAALLVSDRSALPAGSAGVVVPDTLRAFGDLAALHRKRWGGRVVAITGSAGKTTTKELTYAALQAAGARVVRSAGNLNNLVGTPASLLCLDAHSDLAVMEIGTSAPGEIARLSEICAPEIGVVTAVAPAHTAGLGSLEQVAAEKVSLLAALSADGTAIYRAGNPAIAAQLARVRAARRIAFGDTPDADVRLVDHALRADPLMRCELAVREPALTLHCELALFGEGPALDAAAALAVVLAALGPSALAAAAAGLKAVAPIPGRLYPQPGPAGSLILDDSYNANPASMRASISAALELAKARGGRAVLVLGDMLELGAVSRSEHAAVGAFAAQPGVAALIACGTEMTAAAQAAREHTQDAKRAPSIAHLADPTAATDLLRPLLRAGDVLLVKGSRSMGMERIVQQLVTPVPAQGGQA
jgi:UDP-N-acetylmuramoyl-tripeptide--D-alanyl-D-alanine ligase